MNNLNDLKITNTESNIDNGFFFVEFENGKSLQCCLKSYQDDADSEPYYVDQIEVCNSGYTEGLCGDCNEWAAIDGEWSHIEEFLIDQARLVGIEIVA